MKFVMICRTPARPTRAKVVGVLPKPPAISTVAELPETVFVLTSPTAGALLVNVTVNGPDALTFWNRATPVPSKFRMPVRT